MKIVKIYEKINSHFGLLRANLLRQTKTEENSKGQLISKCPFSVNQKTNEILVRISAPASKKRSDKKNSVTELTSNHPLVGLGHKSYKKNLNSAAEWDGLALLFCRY